MLSGDNVCQLLKRLSWLSKDQLTDLIRRSFQKHRSWYELEKVFLYSILTLTVCSFIQWEFQACYLTHAVTSLSLQSSVHRLYFFQLVKNIFEFCNLYSHSECAIFLLLFRRITRNGHQWLLIYHHKGDISNLFPAQKKALQLIIVDANVVFVREQRRDTYYRNDPKKYGLSKQS